jgi:hypothetical protein
VDVLDAARSTAKRPITTTTAMQARQYLPSLFHK